ncbi:class I SAM-dependent methyltransferase [Rubrivivax gelatinosus]|uniref:class I SAM-dependent methyltransferase n=1 Tax=Rubrivivax gelatinosus TaxID=28068 RepID=UPI0002EC9AD0|nr:methyltransferase domain-containing protein [Rubrivivax gelatinosus]MBG6081158.1 SAM-dependent methyltransferase [Rubrivivax gelatinosus]
MPSPTRFTRLNIGCGPEPAPGWLNADRQPAAGVDLVGDLCTGLPLADASVDYAVGMHLLQDIAWPELPAAVAELRRVLRPGGVLRLGLPDLDRAIDAYRHGDAGYFFVPDEHARDIGAKLVTQIIWYGSVRTPFTWGFTRELLQGAGWREVTRCAFGRSASAWPGIASLDNRERESLYVEALA